MMEDGGMSKISNQSFGVFFSFVLHSAIFLRPSASHICYMCTLNASPDLRHVFLSASCGLEISTALSLSDGQRARGGECMMCRVPHCHGQAAETPDQLGLCRSEAAVSCLPGMPSCSGAGTEKSILVHDHKRFR